ncbi:MAG: hypothetical protein UX75_C0036G0031 [Candidatus Moranbacteria bacterium GW2011_GWE2_47_10]|nr:MAG: hypothetical protein UX75_C0036G0031 [Candidatus Moranbacteria bacterium GW2011_GWE2_47_10]
MNKDNPREIISPLKCAKCSRQDTYLLTSGDSLDSLILLCPDCFAELKNKTCNLAKLVLK